MNQKKISISLLHFRFNCYSLYVKCISTSNQSFYGVMETSFIIQILNLQWMEWISVCTLYCGVHYHFCMFSLYGCIRGGIVHILVHLILIQQHMCFATNNKNVKVKKCVNASTIILFQISELFLSIKHCINK